jgi:hypothetical protein
MWWLLFWQFKLINLSAINILKFFIWLYYKIISMTSILISSNVWLLFYFLINIQFYWWYLFLLSWFKNVLLKMNRYNINVSHILYSMLIISWLWIIFQLSKFLQKQAKTGIVKVKELAKGVDSITEIDKSHLSYVPFISTILPTHTLSYNSVT